MSLIKNVHDHYHIQVIGLIRLSARVYKLKTNEKFYCLKFVSDQKLESAYNHILTLKLHHFVRLILNGENQYFTPYEDGYFYLMEYLTADKEIQKEIKLKTYYHFLSYLHQQSFFFQHIDDDFALMQQHDLFSLIQERKNCFEQYMKQFEVMRFRSPSGWMLVLNYCRITQSLQQAYHYIHEYCQLLKQKNEIRLSLTYRHFSYDHIFVYENKLVAIDQMRIDFCIYDIYDMFQSQHTFFDHFDSLLDCYLENVCLQDEEKLLLSALLCIVPEIHFNGHEEHNIHEMSRVLNYLEGIDRVISKLKIDC